MQFTKPVVLGFSLFALAAASAYANDASKQKSGSSQQPSMSQSGDQAFDKLDKNHDGSISREEWNAGQRSGASGSSSPSTGSSSGSSSGSSPSAPAPKDKTDTSKPMGGTSK